MTYAGPDRRLNRYALGHIPGPMPEQQYAVSPEAAALLPVRFELSPLIPILNQGSTPWCEDYTAIEGAEIVHRLLTGKLLGFNVADMAHLTHTGANGTTTAAAEAALANPGALAADGHRYPIACRATPSLATLKQAVMVEGFAGLAMSWYRSWFTPKGTKHDVLPRPSGGVAGGHMFRINGWDDTIAVWSWHGALRMANSWGTGWGSSGYAWLPYAFLPPVLEAYTQLAKPLS